MINQNLRLALPCLEREAFFFSVIGDVGAYVAFRSII
jgi:hypothetical protein